MAIETPRTVILDLLAGSRRSQIPAFTVLSNLTAPALRAYRLRMGEVHRDPEGMMRAAAGAYELYGLPSAVLPTDLCVEAEALGAVVDFREDLDEPMWPLVTQPPFASADAVRIPSPAGFAQRGRIPLVLEALRALAARVVREGSPSPVVVGWVPGPFTLAMQVVDYQALLPAVKQAPRPLAVALDRLTDLLIEVALAYRKAGADVITIHEMGGSPGVIGPRAFGELVLPRVQRLIAALPAPRVLSVCGNTNEAMELLAQSGAQGLNVDEKNDLSRSRRVLGSDVVLLGNLDAVRVLGEGSPEQVRSAVASAVAAGADAVCPGCDMYLETPEENIRAWLAAAASASRQGALF